MKIKAAPRQGTVLLDLTALDADHVGRAIIPGASAKRLFQIKSIVAPIDFSDCSNKALQYALPFAKQFGATLTLVHVTAIQDLPGTDIPTTEFPLLQARIKKETAERLKAYAAAHIPPEIEVKTVLREGRAVAEIVAAAREADADLIILSTHGRTGLKHVLLGSVAENVVRHAPCPVFVVRENEHDFIT
jgi:universal stress protein A